MPGQYIVEVQGDEAVTKALKKMGDVVRPELVKNMIQATLETETVMKDNVPVRTGELQHSIRSEIEIGEEVTGIIGPTGEEGFQLGTEFGRRPGIGKWPPWQAFYLRYGLSIPLAIRAARTVFERGTLPGIRYVEKTLSFIRDKFLRIGIEAAEYIAGQFIS